MAATATDRNTPARYIERQFTLPLAAATTIPAGAMVAINAAGLAVNASDTAGLTVMGRAEHRASTADGDTTIDIARGAFYWGNDGTITQAAVGQLATVLDNQTVSLAITTVNDIGAGYIEEVDATLGVQVSMLGGKVAAA